MSDKTIDGVPRRLLDTLRFWLERANEKNESGDIVELVEIRALLDASAESRRPALDTAPGSTLKVMRGQGGGLYLSGVENLREGDVFRREVRS